MPEFKIYLVDYTATPLFTASKKALLGNRLKNLFESVCAGHTDYTISILWQYPAAILPNELICYYVLNPNKSIIKAKYAHRSGADGLTRFNSANGSLSEVYFTKWKDYPTFLADLTFHEFMHNKFEGGATGSHVHDDHDGFGQSILMNNLSDIDDDNPSTPDDERLNHEYRLTGNNIAAMFSALSINVPQDPVTQEEYSRLMRPRPAARR